MRNGTTVCSLWKHIGNGIAYSNGCSNTGTFKKYGGNGFGVYGTEDRDNIGIAGQEYVDFDVCMEDDTTKMYQKYCAREQDGYIVLIVITYMDEAELEEAISAFSAY